MVNIRLKLVETKADASSMRIVGIPENTLIINLDDYFDAPKKIFVNSKSETCRCDFIILSDDDKETHCIFIELKSGTGENSHIKNQLRGGRAFISYCQQILEEFWGYRSNWKQFKYHYVVCKNSTTEKNQRNHKPKKPNTCVDDMLCLMGNQKFQFNQLICNRKLAVSP